ncbi:MAG TPA: alpha/beta hydrolase [Candidatus Acidoferrales bacterium]|jgi:pimeloyl-ACP methyl ester carboxylesterase|nr:alpha/beta hydrolase [Candidatus Acidoferrales bacterium]
MERRRFLGALTAASLGVSLKASFTEIARAQHTSQAGTSSAEPAAKRSEFPENSTIVLVHAAWADGSCWSNIILPLERRGLKVTCVPIPLTSLTNDATALSWALERTTGPLVLVGHAYSGAVIAAVREDRVKSLVYVTALAPDEGETVAKVFYRETPSPEAPKMVPDSHGLVWMPDDAFHRALAQNASAEQAKIAAAVQRPLSVQCIQEPMPTPLWKSKPSWFLIADEDRMINPKTQRFMADRMGATVRPHLVDHTPMYSAPAVVVDVILEAALKTLVLESSYGN